MALQVEIDVLTGQTTILQTDIIYDCGQSLNPAVDLGQVMIFNMIFNTLQHLGFFLFYIQSALTNKFLGSSVFSL